MNPIELSEISAGFAEISLGSQSTFRSALEAISYPGRHVKLDMTFEAPKVAHATSSGLLLALLEPGSTLWLSPSLLNTEAATWIVFHTDCRITTTQHDADFAWIKSWNELPRFDSFALGTDEYPDQSTTCIIDIVASDLTPVAAPVLSLAGPGIASTTTFELLGATKTQIEGFVEQWTQNHGCFPRGVDVYFATSTGLIGLPRTTCVEILGSDTSCM